MVAVAAAAVVAEAAATKTVAVVAEAAQVAVVLAVVSHPPDRRCKPNRACILESVSTAV